MGTGHGQQLAKASTHFYFFVLSFGVPGLPKRQILPSYTDEMKTGALPAPPLQRRPPPIGGVMPVSPIILPTEPPTADNSCNIVNWGVMENNRIGDCVIGLYRTHH
jgi:hypothetical protein